MKDNPLKSENEVYPPAGRTDREEGHLFRREERISGFSCDFQEELMKKTVRDIDVREKRVFVRCDFNVPTDGEGNITDDRRIRGALPTIEYLAENGFSLLIWDGRRESPIQPFHSAW